MHSVRHFIHRAGGGLRHELRPMLTLAWPVVLAELGWMTMGLVDTVMVGRVSPEAIGAVGIGGNIYAAIVLFGIGLLLGLDYLVSHAFGAGDLPDCNRSLLHGVYLCLAIWPVLAAAMYFVIDRLPQLGVQPAVLVLTIDYTRVIVWCLLPGLLHAALRRYLQGRSIVKPLMITLASANLVNVIANWILIFGHLGAPALGPTGAGYATLLSMIFMFLSLLIYVLYAESRDRTGLFATPLAIEWPRLRKLLALGLPVAIQLLLEVGLFATVAVLAGQLRASSLAAHHIVLKVISFTFMVPLGISAAGAVRVGQGLGRKEPGAAVRSGWTALLLGAGFMALAALLLILLPEPILGLFTADDEVVAVGVLLLYVAAVFQIFDGLQVVSTGVLRGTGETRIPMIVNFIGHWFLGLPVGYFLCFKLSWDILGLWIGFCVSLVAIGASLLYYWTRRVRMLMRVSQGESFVHPDGVAAAQE